MRIFVTGGTGSLGRYLLPLLGRHEVLCLGRAAPVGPGQPWVRYVQGDFGDPGTYFRELEEFRPDCCVHLAWGGIPDYSHSVCRANVEASINLFEALNRLHCSAVVAGTCWEYGSLTGELAETLPGRAPKLFAAFKSGLQTIGSAMFEAAGDRFVWGRIFFAYGPGQRPKSLIPSCHRSFREGVPPQIANPGAVNDFIHAEDVASAFLALLDPATPSGIYNIGSGQPASVAEVVNLVAAHFRRPIPYPDAVRGSGFWADASKLKALGWRPKFTLQTGVSNTLEAMDRT